jgi:hypothetical protein
LKEHFLFRPGQWKGKGNISIPLTDEPFPINVQWTISLLEEGKFRAVQVVEIDDQEPMTNIFTVSCQSDTEFQLFLDNETLGGVFAGTGIFDDKKLAWEFAHSGAIEGFEVYERGQDDLYTFRAEYSGGEGFSNQVSGSLEEIK